MPAHRACTHERRCASELHGRSPLNAADFRPFRRSNHVASPSRNQVSRLLIFLESIFQDPCPTLNGTRRVTMPQVLTRRSEPIHPSSQARSPAPTNPKTGSGSDHPGGRSPQLNCLISSSAQSQSHCRAICGPFLALSDECRNSVKHFCIESHEGRQSVRSCVHSPA